ncbi:hypothetical protein [Halobacillus amylolyticus]|uniref:Uncharacterized protein n=1 Tax=Halobacillus amylolyticus TaxID=2932259 RepID=A0ABY4HHI4_9BACI|nr:hypothetical protein [Halobacillus amylolyticus]UOR14147.1 hypothetical protein MUO15_20875 [Halobacillus amylolyticus]
MDKVQQFFNEDQDARQSLNQFLTGNDLKHEKQQDRKKGVTEPKQGIKL